MNKDLSSPGRRGFLRTACAAAGAALVGGCGGGAPQYVLVHGAWHGGWAWDRVVPLLEAAGATVYAPTLAGLGERANEMSTKIDLDRHIADIVHLVRRENLRDVVLVGHSYGGFPVTGAIEALAHERRLRCAVYLDAFVPTDGDRLFNYLDAAGQAQMQADFAAANPRWPKIPAMYFGLETQADVDWVDARLTDHPSGTYLQPLRMKQPAGAAAPQRHYISCTSPALDVLAATKARVRADASWDFTEIAAGHDVMVSRPRELADLLLGRGLSMEHVEFPSEWDVIVVGAGSAGVAAAIAASRTGARTLLLDASPLPGGELISGISLLGCLSSRGDWIVGGVVTELLERVKALGGYIGPVFDYRALHLVCFDAELMKIAITAALAEAGVRALMPSFVFGAAQDAQGMELRVVHKGGERKYRAPVVIDCSGDGDVAVLAGAEYDIGGPGGHLQPPTLVYRVCNVETEPLLDFVRREPENFGLGDYPGLGMNAQQCAEALYRQGLAKVLLRGSKGLLRQAIADGEMYPTSVLAIVPTSLGRKEVSINSTQVAGVDGTRADSVSAALPQLMAQVQQGLSFLRRRVPGFEKAELAAVAPRIGIRETRRIRGDYVLTGDDILRGRKRADGIAKGGHELDILAVDGHRHETIAEGGTYDIPLDCLIPRGQKRLLVAGRCLSSTREAQSSARVMGTCMAMGQAAGTAAALCATDGRWDGDVRSVDRQCLRERLKADGAILEGTP